MLQLLKIQRQRILSSNDWKLNHKTLVMLKFVWAIKNNELQSSKDKNI